VDTYVPGAPESPLQAGEVFEEMQKLSGEPEPDQVTESFKVDLESAPNLIKNVEQKIEEVLE